MMSTWVTARLNDGQHYVALMDEFGQTVRLHPIPFATALDADRGAARLNARDAGIAGVPVPTAPEDEVRAARQARIAELRARRQSA